LFINNAGAPGFLPDFINVNTSAKNSSYHSGKLGALLLCETEEATHAPGCGLTGFGSKRGLQANAQTPEKQNRCRIDVSPADFVCVSL